MVGSKFGQGLIYYHPQSTNASTPGLVPVLEPCITQPWAPAAGTENTVTSCIPIVVINNAIRNRQVWRIYYSPSANVMFYNLWGITLVLGWLILLFFCLSDTSFFSSRLNIYQYISVSGGDLTDYCQACSLVPGQFTVTCSTVGSSPPPKKN